MRFLSTEVLRLQGSPGSTIDTFTSPHTRVFSERPHTCAVCSTSFSRNQDLEQHSSAFGHQAFLCACGKQFSRASTLTRHVSSHDVAGPKYPCEWCDDKSFPRRDKLRDHIRAFHRFGPRALRQFREDTMAETTQSNTSSSLDSSMTSSPTLSSQHNPALRGLAFPAPIPASASASIPSPVYGYAPFDFHHGGPVSHLKALRLATSKLNVFLPLTRFTRNRSTMTSCQPQWCILQVLGGRFLLSVFQRSFERD